MNPVAIFAAQFVWFVVVWATIAVAFVEPKLKGRDAAYTLSVWVAPQMLRMLGLGLLVPNLAPGMPGSFALSTAIGDAVTAGLALASVLALTRRWSHARALVWACTIIGTCDLLIALVQAARVEAARYLAAQWFVPAVIVPLMVVCHVMAWRTLMATRRAAPPPAPSLRLHGRE